MRTLFCVLLLLAACADDAVSVHDHVQCANPDEWTDPPMGWPIDYCERACETKPTYNDTVCMYETAEGKPAFSIGYFVAFDGTLGVCVFKEPLNQYPPYNQQVVFHECTPQ